jgi:uncharacterized protein YbjQ (UPF0145 family)
MTDPSVGVAEARAQAEDRERRRVGMLLSTTESVPGHCVVTHVGLVSATASTTNKSTDEIDGIFNKQEGRMSWAIQEATARLVDKAAHMGANAIVGLVLAVNESEGSTLSWRSTGVGMLGTAVIVTPEQSTEGGDHA